MWSLLRNKKDKNDDQDADVPVKDTTVNDNTDKEVATPSSELATQEKKTKWSIKIQLRNGLRHEYSRYTQGEHRVSCISYYLRFYLWFYTRRDSPAYTFSHKDGADIILRSEIVSVSMRKEVIG
jgi:hypothetical protein